MVRRPVGAERSSWRLRSELRLRRATLPAIPTTASSTTSADESTWAVAPDPKSGAFSKLEPCVWTTRAVGSPHSTQRPAEVTEVVRPQHRQRSVQSAHTSGSSGSAGVGRLGAGAGVEAGAPRAVPQPRHRDA